MTLVTASKIFEPPFLYLVPRAAAGLLVRITHLITVPLFRLEYVLILLGSHGISN